MPPAPEEGGFSSLRSKRWKEKRDGDDVGVGVGVDSSHYLDIYLDHLSSKKTIKVLRLVLLVMVARLGWRALSRGHGAGRALEIGPLTRGIHSLPSVVSGSPPTASVTHATREDALAQLSPVERIREMRHFWMGLGITDQLAKKMARQSAEFGRVWSNPPALLHRLNAMQTAIPMLNLATILDQTPGLLLYRPERLCEKLTELSTLLPGADVLKMVSVAPDVLQRDMSKVAARISSLRALSRGDVSELIAEHPQLLRMNEFALCDRVAVLTRAYGAVLLQRIPRARLAALLQFSSNRLKRLEYLSAIYPGVRGRVSDMKLLRMSTVNFQKGFKPRRMTPQRLTAAKSTRSLGPRQPIDKVPAGANVFRLGERHLKEWRENIAHERQLMLESGSGSSHAIFPRRNQGRRPTERHPDFARSSGPVPIVASSSLPVD